MDWKRRYLNNSVYIIRYIIYNLFLRIYLQLRTKFARKNVTQKHNQPYIISITTFPEREKSFQISLETVMWQTFKPDRIIVWLAKEQYSDRERVIRTFNRFIKRGVEFEFCDDLKSHKKYYYSMLENSDSVVITMDDDVYYPKNTVERLVNKYDGKDKTIISNMAMFIKIEKGEIQPYVEWKSVNHFTIESKQYLCPIGVGGILYSPNSISSEAFNKKSIQQLCKHTDDLWLNGMGRINDAHVICLGDFPVLITVAGSQTQNLGVENTTRNDTELRNIIEKYPLSFGGYKVRMENQIPGK